MLTLKSSPLSFGVGAALGSIMMLSTTMAMTAEAQSGRVKARSDRGVATAVQGANGSRAARARGCNQVEGAQTCGSTAGVIGANGAMAGRVSAPQFGEDGSFSRDAGAFAQSQYGEGRRTLNSQLNPDGSGQRSVDGYALSETGFAERKTLTTVDENGNAIRSGAASASGDFGAFSSEGAGTYSYEDGLDYARESQASASNEIGSVQGETNSSFSRDGGFVRTGEAYVTTAEGGTLDANVSYDAENGLERSAICANPQGETVPCTN